MGRRFWEDWVSAAFLGSYLGNVRGASFLPAENKAMEILLEAFLLDKAFYELDYELNNRPAWVRIPLLGILAFLGDGTGGNA